MTDLSKSISLITEETAGKLAVAFKAIREKALNITVREDKKIRDEKKK